MVDASISRQGCVLIAAGGTGGHVFPALAVAQRLHEQNIPVLWVGSKKGIEARVVPANNIELVSFSVSGLRGKRWSAMVLAPFQLAGAVVKVMRLALRRRVMCMLGTGGYVSAASGVAAILLRKPFFLQEQNAVAGTTNKLLAPFAKKIFTAYPQVFAERSNVRCCGNPLRREFVNLPTPVQRNVGVGEQLRVLVVGGSLGASALNHAMPAALARLAGESALARNLQVVHQSGAAECGQVQQMYRELSLDATVTPFIDDVATALQSADLVIARAGALTLSELTAVGVAALLVPYPYAIDDHQTANAQWLVDNDAARMIVQPNLDSETINAVLLEMLQQAGGLQAMALRSRALAKTDAAALIAQACKEYVDAS
ncbi:MAG: undecaprenyldiphospho-muramoylpentapeptide beta-N-acetylglucosaminyltransferase [Pseudomonadales bacterium]|nr:undecaprenyldiphospho-muramoylpentapeptide beta-N-acetylglucosaminyltransferase [Pseudomonadales bacterium]